ncbi:hypothetical protein AVEN_34961-1 [Araneus ventricosus]|uniref:Uncharacterized protein n=1 Tax=Araneus ventricosus TaxID=182803 RepID=A0A4Y2MXQ4_ARAVE|nr:hypothetical protein AVEN_34961-1 [Araneus ventricosus]
MPTNIKLHHRTPSIRIGSVLGQTQELKDGTSIRKYCTFCKRKVHCISSCYTRNPKLLFDLHHSEGTFYSDDHNFKKLCYSTAAPVDLDEWLVDSAATSNFCKERDGMFRGFQESTSI